MEWTMHTNRLANEKSPYLLQHAHNPVDWHSWGPEAFRKAQAEDKPIFLSIGYSTCHWCHVMERESFENEAVAEVLNRYFIPIKVDREERPDVDRIYMMFVQATTGSGGWPMSVWLTPDLKPFYGGTYFPPDSRWGRPGFVSVLEQLAKAWQTDRSQIIQSGQEIVEELEKHLSPGVAYRPDTAILESGFLQFRRSFDSRLGGFGSAPKFPRGVAYNFLFRYSQRTRTEEAAEMVLFTLREMAKGGMNDQLGGGFHRYSVDAKWFVPHFEKMLYDQAQLAVSYLEGYQISGDRSLAQVARDILEYVLRDMTDPTGGFYSAEDADSVIDPSNPKEKGEGAFYIWNQTEIDDVLGKPAADWFCYVFGVERDGNVAEDPHGEFTGRNILYQRRSIADAARQFHAEEEHVRVAIEEASRKLLDRRSVTRVRPHLDDKVLTAWNGLMISALAKGGFILDAPRYLDAAKRSADFVLHDMVQDGVLLRRWRQGESAIPGFLDDYAFFVQGLLDLYEASFETKYLNAANELTAKMRELFEDKDAGAFYSTTVGDASLVMRIKEDYDGAEPSGNSIAVLNLLRLSHIFGAEDYRASAEKALHAFSSKMGAGPTSMPQMLTALMRYETPPQQIVLAGENIKDLVDALRTKFLPHHTLLRAGDVAAADNMPPVDGKPAAYVCENFACQMPVTDPAALAELLK
jgi:uncharacterized protein YyaL (SSP411 family)